MPNSTTDKLLAIIAHLGYFSGVGFLIAPAIIWFLKKDSSPFVAHHAKQAMVWQGANLVFGTLFCLGGFVLTFVTAGLGALLFVPACFLLGLLLFIPSILASIKVFGDQEYSYPVTGAYAEKL
jgi:uncharacterized Tic20 family protein